MIVAIKTNNPLIFKDSNKNNNDYASLAENKMAARKNYSTSFVPPEEFHSGIRGHSNRRY